MEGTKGKKTGIDLILEQLERFGKSRKSEELDKSEEYEDKPYISEEEEEMDEEVEKSEDEEYEDEEEVEKSEDEFEYEDEEEMDEEIEKSEDEVMEMEYDEVYDMLLNDIMGALESKFAEFEETLSKVVNAVGTQADIVEDTYEKSMQSDLNLRKSVETLEAKLQKLSKSRKSVQNINIQEKYKPEPKVLSKSEKAGILADLLAAGDKTISLGDITNAELGKPISMSAQRAIEKTLR